MSTLGAQRIVDLELHIPPTGGCWGTLKLEQGALPPLGFATLQLGDLPLVVSVVRRGYDAPATPRVVVAGGAGWRTLLPAPGGSYSSAGGVRLLTVLRDLAAIAGEPYDAPAEASLGPFYGWETSTPLAALRARHVLADIVVCGAIPTWRVTPGGRTRFDAWPALPAADQHVDLIPDRLLEQGRRGFSVKGSAAALLPGAVLDGATIARVKFTESAEALEAMTWET